MQWFNPFDGNVSSGGGGGEGNATVITGKTSYWESTPSKKSEKNTIYVYTDYMTDGADNEIPAIKIGDDLTTIVELPFLAGSAAGTITDESIEKWNNKITVKIDPLDDENLVFSTE